MGPFGANLDISLGDRRGGIGVCVASKGPKDMLAQFISIQQFLQSTLVRFRW